MKSFSTQDIARLELLDILGAHIEKGAYKARFGPEEKEFTEMKRRELTIIFNDLADQWGYVGYEEG
tara:strand:- start:714 stop:911 length:198 start_codon:yes stop_codon:yes gene_type:complete